MIFNTGAENNNLNANSLTYNEETDYFGVMHNGEWKNVVYAGFLSERSLFNNANVSLLDNWSANSYRREADDTHTAILPTLAVNDNGNMVIKAKGNQQGMGSHGSVWLNDAIDFSKYSVLEFNVVSGAINTTNCYCWLAIVSQKKDGYEDIELAHSENFIAYNAVNTGVFTVDLTNVNTSGYIVFYCAANNLQDFTGEISYITLK